MFGKGESGLLSSFGTEADAERGAADREAEFQGGFFEGMILTYRIPDVKSLKKIVLVRWYWTAAAVS